MGGEVGPRFGRSKVWIPRQHSDGVWWRWEGTGRMAMVDRRDGQLSRLMIYLIEDISTIYCVLSVYQTLFVSKLLGAIGSDCDKW